jgi:probable phosphoglycerate mutase
MAKRVEFYLCRHGATRQNAEDSGTDRIRGWMDLPLSDIGRKEVKRLAFKLEDSGIKHIISSDMLRAKQTADAIAATTNAKVSHERGLRPWDLGKFTGMESSKIADQILSYAKNKPDAVVPQGESFETFSHRCLSTLARVIDANRNTTFCIVTHHRVERLLKGWVDAGEKPSWDINWATFNKHGERTANCEIFDVDAEMLMKAAASEEKTRKAA